VTWTVTIDDGRQEVVLPNGLRYQGAAEVVLSDRWHSLLSASALSSLMSAESLGGTASYTVTVADGVSMAALPNGLVYGAGDVVVLSDEEYSVITPSAAAALFSSVDTTVS
jgi:hypothetical protein